MAESGGGNFYYIQTDSDIIDSFQEEFNGISSTLAYNTKLNFSLNKGFEVTECLNSYKVENGSYFLPNVTKNKISILFNIKSKNLTKLSNADFGTGTLHYNDHLGLEQKITFKIISPLVSKSQFLKIEDNQEVKIQEIILRSAESKLAASLEAKSGNIEKAKNILRATHNTISAGTSNYQDSRLFAESDSINNTILTASDQNPDALTKSLFYQSYKTRTNK